jgi:hypothetical protein
MHYDQLIKRSLNWSTVASMANELTRDIIHYTARPGRRRNQIQVYNMVGKCLNRFTYAPEGHGALLE